MAPRFSASLRFTSCLLLLAPVAVGAALAAPHATDELWYDEAYTLEYFAAGGPTRAFMDYHAPNNHVAFSAGLAAWRNLLHQRETASIPALRLFPGLAFLLSIACGVVAFERIGGIAVGLAAGLLLATSHVALNFALQLRGYGPSWLPVTAGLLALFSHLRSRSGRSLAAYLASAVAGVGILPTNILPFGVLSAWGILLTWLSGAGPDRRSLMRLVVIAFAPVAGLACYGLVFEKLLANATGFATSYTTGGVLMEWTWATLDDLWWLWAFVALGLIVLVREAHRNPLWDAASPRGQVLFLAAVVIVPQLFLILMPHAPFPRNLVPLLPLWYGILALMLMAPFRSASHAAPTAARAAGIAIAISLVLTATLRESREAGYADRNPEGTKPQNLYDLYYHHRFYPSQAVAEIRALAAGRDTVVVTDDADLWAIQAYGGTHTGARLLYERALHFTPDDLPEMARCRMLLLTYGAVPAHAIINRLHLPVAVDLSLRADTGFFKIYESRLR